MTRIETHRFVDGLEEPQITRLLGIEHIDGDRRLLLLAEVFHNRVIENRRVSVYSMLEIEIDLKTPKKVKGVVIEKNFNAEFLERTFHKRGIKQQNLGQFVQNCWVVADYWSDKTYFFSKVNFVVDVYDSSTKRHIKSTLFPLVSQEKKFMIYPNPEDLERTDNTAILYLVTTEYPESLENVREEPNQLIVEKFVVTNLLDVTKETEFELVESLELDNPKSRNPVFFNKFAPEVAIASDWVELRERNNGQEKRTKSLLKFYDENFRLVDQVVHPFLTLNSMKVNFSGLGEGGAVLRF